MHFLSMGFYSDCEEYNHQCPLGLSRKEVLFPSLKCSGTPNSQKAKFRVHNCTPWALYHFQRPVVLACFKNKASVAKELVCVPCFPAMLSPKVFN